MSTHLISSSRISGLNVDGKFRGQPSSDTVSYKFGLVVRQVEALVLMHLPERLSEESICKLCGIELTTLRKAFCKVHRTTLYLALRRLRTWEVKRRLDADIRLSLEEAMRQCGFGSYMGFSAEFRRHFGVDPKQYRELGNRLWQLPGSLSERSMSDNRAVPNMPSRRRQIGRAAYLNLVHRDVNERQKIEEFTINTQVMASRIPTRTSL